MDQLYPRFGKRGFDLALAVPALLIASPAIAILAIGVRITSPGSAFFLQERIGRNRRPFQLVKLRTMIDAAERVGPQFTASGDPRVTRFGSLLRAAKLDELPQLWNVVRGDMSLVGPRPEVRRYTEQYRREWDAMFSVRPGITDAASIVFRQEEELLATARDRARAYIQVLVPFKIELALEGIERCSLAYDMSILVQTAVAVLKRRTRSDHPLLERAREAISRLESEASNGSAQPAEAEPCKAAS